MRILLVADYPFDVSTSMPRFAEMLEEELRGRGHAVTLLRISTFFGRLHRAGAVGKWLGYLDKYVLFPIRLRGARNRGWDAIHICDHSYSMYLGPLTGRVIPSITCHDLLAVLAAEGRFGSARVVSATGRMQQRWIRRGLRKARRVVCVSEKTASDLRAIGCMGRIEVIHNALNRPFTTPDAAEVRAARSRAGLTGGERYLLHVGSNSWYKNRPGVLRIFAALRRRAGFEGMRLVMAGRAWTPEMRAITEQEGLGGSAVALVEPGDAELGALYAGAEALLYPSLAEGFGWPVLEAQASGCAVITSDREPMREVAGEAAVLVDPEDAEAAAETIAARWEELEEMRRRGLENVRRFERGAMIDRYERFFAEGAVRQ
jgi:glycosyltransferase involved in cell wall biosynthesis